METWGIIKDIGIPVVTGVISWFAGRYARKSDAIRNLQETVDMLLVKNKELVTEVEQLRNENVTLRGEIGVLCSALEHNGIQIPKRK